ncbi:MAG TPA: lysylphosphatidylglycerol synthase transmembrane domain-containing protein, partial [Ignavibacteriaceae bacterium]|nr:lysylphosphatidylglycerol synthase transmembrane domain-containing protein [Ignavibacteriaceae bacterium]
LIVAALLTGHTSTVFKTIRFAYFFPAPGRYLKLYGAFAFLRVLYYVLPFNSGELVYLAVLKKYKFSPGITETAPTWLFIRLTDIIALSCWIIFILFFSPLTGTLFGKLYSVRWIIIGFSAALIVFILSYRFWVPKIPTGKVNHWISSRLQQFKSGFNRTFGVKNLLKTIGLSIVVWCMLILFDTFTLFAFNIPLNFLECFLASIAVYSISLLPINAPFNLGTGEALWAGVLVLSGIDSTLAVSIALSIRLVNIIVLLAEGLIGSILFLQVEREGT